MAEEAEYIIQLRDGNRYGPAARPALLQWAREGRIPIDAMLIRRGQSEAINVLSDPELAPIVQAPPTAPTGLRSTEPRSTSAMIPAGNPSALIGYYFAVLGVLAPGVGLIAIVLGIFGLRRVRRYPAVKGTAHAWVAILGGAFVTIVWTFIIIGRTLVLR
jgi:hypothetical protein